MVTTLESPQGRKPSRKVSEPQPGDVAAVTITRRTDGKIRKGRISAKLGEAIKLCIFDGLTKKDAAKRAGMTLTGFSKALAKPHVKAYWKEIEQARDDDWPNAALGTIKQLMDKSESDHVRLSAAQYIRQELGEHAKSLHNQSGTKLIIQIEHKAEAGGLIIDQKAGTVKSQWDQGDIDNVLE